jgi:hypothetical protein
MNHLSPVIPASAGIPLLSGFGDGSGIPAFAAMTKDVVA